jgi:hypothetical protein
MPRGEPKGVNAVPGMPIRSHPTIACCGIDCGLCPRYHTVGSSRCPGCGADGFGEKHPSCSILTCCTRTKSLETCAGCAEFPCQRIAAWDKADSFVSHRKSLANLVDIRNRGLGAFLSSQEARIRLLDELKQRHDDGRSRSFFCLSAALLPPGRMRKAIAEIAKASKQGDLSPRQTAQEVRKAFEKIAIEEHVELKYRRGP